MWLLLGLLGSMTALSASDLFTAQGFGAGNADDTDDDPQDEDDDSGAPNGFSGIATGFPDDDPGEVADGGQGATPPSSDVGAADPPSDDPAMGLFDGLGLRVHSSDVFPDPEPDTFQTLAGDENDNTLRGAALDDVIAGNGGHDSLAGHGGNDWLDGGAGDDSLIGGDGDDTLLGGAGNDTLIGGLGHDLMIAGSGDNTVMAGDGDDTLLGQAGSSFLNGGNGSDLLQAGAGNQLHGGAGDDIFLLPGAMPGADGPAHILDYAADEDQIQLSYDPAQGLPELSITFAADTPGLAEIRIDGNVMATVANAGTLSPSDIALVAQTGPTS
ncbi:Hemolysin, chromosomal [Roseibaca ekhonensis]|jgi:Ca2+-binding RTX toxin-like protein|uniref:Hemolysin, chromosomal n=1 Tax=Roseinatronobacter ekhonensis TaxID=254356 RepID=A0A3B0M771_9RHOB|nr:calcium-binding protein [Roseibaca ekhonensis]SUZ31533.1 Hemolysin, chromosomal [Roseibaca ekhonensis]